MENPWPINGGLVRWENHLFLWAMAYHGKLLNNQRVYIYTYQKLIIDIDWMSEIDTFSSIDDVSNMLGVRVSGDGNVLLPRGEINPPLTGYLFFSGRYLVGGDWNHGILV